jgi:hypothetical protein
MTERDDKAFQAAAEQVVAESLEEEAKTLLTLRKAAEVVNEPFPTVKGWVYRYHALPVVYVGKGRVRVRLSELRRFYFGQAQTNSVAVSSIRQ